MLRTQMLGRFAVQVGDVPIAEDAWRRSAAAKVIKLLALTPGHRLHRDQVIELLFPKLEPRAAANNFYRTLHLARRVLEPALPARGASMYVRLHGEVLAVGCKLTTDVLEFEACAQRARTTRAPDDYSAALALYGGELLPDDRYDDWINSRRERLHQEYVGLLREAALTHEALGNIDSAIDLLRQLVAIEPTDESAHVALMRLLALTGKRSEALNQFDTLRATLRGELGTEPLPKTRMFYRDLRLGRLSRHAYEETLGQLDRGRTATTPRSNLPANLASFIGRGAERAEVRALVQASRLVTLTGAGGCGKTRLALEAAASLASSFPDGVWWVELAPVLESELVPAAVARVVGVSERPNQMLMQALVDSLRSQRVLLVLDNCEHLVDGCAALAVALLGACPQLRVLATTRERLGCRGEMVWQVPPLNTPKPDRQIDTDVLEQYDAIQLFVSRARTMDSTFELNRANAPAVAHICRRLEGIPLAIELAVTRLQVVSPDELAQLLDDLLGVLSTGERTALARHKTVRATLDWSYGMLDPSEQAVLRAVSVFTGGFSRAAAECIGQEAVECSGRALLDLLMRLVDKSLVQVERNSPRVRYTLLETVRQYGIERLSLAGEESHVREFHRDWCVQFAEEAAIALDGPRWTDTLETMDADAANLKAALAGCQERGEIGYALQLAGALWRYWFLRGEISEGRRWVDGLLADTRSADVAMPHRIRAILGAGWFAFHQGDLATATARLTQAVELGDDPTRAAALLGLGNSAEERGDYEAAARHYRASLELERQLGRQARVALVLDHLSQWAAAAGENEEALELADESLELRRSLGDEVGAARAWCNRGIALAHLGRLEAAEAALAESVRLRRLLGDALGLAMSSLWLGYVALDLGDVARAAASEAEGLMIARARGVMWGIMGGFVGMGLVLREAGDLERAALFVGCLDAAVESTGIVVKAGDAAVFADLQRDLRERLGDCAFDAALRAGRAMPLNDAVDMALGVLQLHTARPPTGTAGARGQGGLTAREREIAAMIVRGDTNSQIASALSLSRRTVDTHVTRILQKRGVSSRLLLAANL